jgi:hypothetical protein
MKFALANDGAGGAKPDDLDLYVRSAADSAPIWQSLRCRGGLFFEDC